MGSKGNTRHIKRLASAKYLHIERKVKKYVAKPNAGRHTLKSSAALTTVIKEKLGIAKNSWEARRALKEGKVQVNGKTIKDERYPIGFGDIIHFIPSNESYQVNVGKNYVMKLDKTEKKEERLFKVVGKYIAKGNKMMIRLHDGSTVHGNKDINVNDSVMLTGSKVGKVLKLEKGAKCLVIKGIHASEGGMIKEIKAGTATRDATVEIESKTGKTETLLDNIMVIGA